MNLNINKHVVIVTGGGTEGDGIGNGRATAILFAREGCRVVVVDKNLNYAEKTVDMIKKEKGEALAIQGNVALMEDCEKIVDTTIKNFESVDFLINNVGVPSKKRLKDIQSEDLSNLLSNNLFSSLNMIRCVVTAMEKNNGGVIINISSSVIGARRVGMTAYSMAKGVVDEMTKSLAADLGDKNIRVNCIAPGPIYTPMACKDISKEEREKRKNISLLRIEGEPWDVGNMAMFLCSEKAKYITGQILNVDGGINLTGPLF